MVGSIRGGGGGGARKLILKKKGGLGKIGSKKGGIRGKRGYKGGEKEKLRGRKWEWKGRNKGEKRNRTVFPLHFFMWKWVRFESLILLAFPNERIWGQHLWEFQLFLLWIIIYGLKFSNFRWNSQTRSCKPNTSMHKRCFFLFGKRCIEAMVDIRLKTFESRTPTLSTFE